VSSHFRDTLYHAVDVKVKAFHLLHFQSVSRFAAAAQSFIETLASVKFFVVEIR
jgi:hypothetical protein